MYVVSKYNGLFLFKEKNCMKSMIKKIVYADFNEKCQNYGNHIIEFATKKLIHNKYEEVFRFDSFYYNGDINQSLEKIDHDFILIPGCTMYTNGQNRVLNKIDPKFKIKGLAGSIWTDNFFDEKKIILGKTFSTKNKIVADLDIVKKIDGVIGCRDSFTYRYIKNSGLSARYVGCPTLFIDESDISYKNQNDDYCLFSFSRENIKQQIYIARELSKKYRIVGICHEIKDFNIIKSLGWEFPLIDYDGNVQRYLSYFMNAALVITGRLHGLLPSIALDKKVIYFGNDDSRTTLLDDILVRKFNLKDILSVDPQNINKNIIYDLFESNMNDQIDEIFKL